MYPYMRSDTVKVDKAVEPEVRRFLEGLAAGGGRPLEELAPNKARKVLVSLQARVPWPSCAVSHKVVGDAGVRLTIVRPSGAAGRGVLPAFMFFHGGGWVLGDFETHERMVRDLVEESGAVGVFVNYTRSPEAGYGVALEEAYAGTVWVAEHGAEIDVDGSRLAVAGNSVGGNMATVMALLSRDRGGPKLRGQILFWPVTSTNLETASYKRFGVGHFLTRGMMKWFWDSYTTDESERRQITASPLRARVTQLVGLPPTLIQTAECDVLRDEGEAYGRKLMEAGVSVTSVRYNGMIHDFGLLNGISRVPGVRSALEQAGAYIKKCLK